MTTGLNLVKMMYISLDVDEQTVGPAEMILVDLDLAQNIRSRFAVMSNDTHSLLEFNNLRSALRFVTLIDDKYFYTREFYDNFRIVELTGDDNDLRITAVILNLVDFWDIICAIKDGQLDKDYFSDEDFNLYYEKYIDVI